MRERITMRKLGREFKEFISRGNVMDLAIGVIMGSAFTAIVNSLVKDIFTPLLGLLTGGFDFEALAITLGEGENAAQIAYGAFISAVINFLLISIVVFMLIKTINRFRRKKEEEAPAPERLCPYCCQPIAQQATRCPHCTSVLEGESVVAQDN